MYRLERHYQQVKNLLDQYKQEIKNSQKAKIFTDYFSKVAGAITSAKQALESSGAADNDQAQTLDAQSTLEKLNKLENELPQNIVKFKKYMIKPSKDKIPEDEIPEYKTQLACNKLEKSYQQAKIVLDQHLLNKDQEDIKDFKIVN